MLWIFLWKRANRVMIERTFLWILIPVHLEYKLAKKIHFINCKTLHSVKFIL